MQSMKNRSELYAALGLSLALSVITLIPYLYAQQLAEPAIFTGFLINPIDGFSYLAKMRQGAEGAWLFQLPYAPEPGSGAFVFVFFLFLGRVAGWMGVPLLTVFHATRILAVACMGMVTFLFFRLVLPGGRVRWIATILALFGSGLGWMALSVGIQASDLSIPESIPFLLAYSNAHFPLAAALMLGGVLLVLSDGRVELRVLSGLACGVLLGLVQPFSVFSLAVFLGVWLVWEMRQGGREGGAASLWANYKSRILPFLALMLGALPWLVYDFWLTQTHPALSAWSLQNKTPSPPLISYIFGYGLILLLAVIGTYIKKPYRSSHGRLLVAWVVSNAVLLYAPFNLQRRLTLGLFFPLAGLAALGIDHLVKRRRRLIPVLLVVLLFSVPSNLLVMSAGLTGVSRGEPAVVHSRDEINAYEWLKENAPSGALVLAAPDTGNRLPAFANLRVLYGHPFETPDAETQEALVRSLYASTAGIEEANLLLNSQGVDYIFFGERERELGEPPWLEKLPQVFQSGKVEIHEVVRP